jgi:ADP-dependent NAD(P)H-hydrate dehydratase
MIPKLPIRESSSHKGNFGRVLLIGGSRGMAGAISIAGMAALRGGAGLVSIGTPMVVADVVAQFHPCYMTMPLPCDEGGRLSKTALSLILSASRSATCVALGPGLGRSSDVDFLINELFRIIEVPLVLDADGINGLQMDGLSKNLIQGKRVLTPHPGEMERLTGVAAHQRDAQTKIAESIAIKFGWTIALKGHRTVVTNGERTEINRTGNPKMATGGSGDCLTGLIAALIAQGLPPYEATHLGVVLHGKAGDIAAAKLASPSVLATDIIDALPEAFAWANSISAE